MFEGLRKPTTLIVIVVTLLAYGCPIQAIVHAFGLDERTVAAWRDRAGMHCQKVHQKVIEQGTLDMVHVQADEIWIKARGKIAWMGLAIIVPTRLWIAGVVSKTRDKELAESLLQQVRRCSRKLCDLLICTDGWSAYPNSIKKAFREKTKKSETGERYVFEVWPGLHIGTVIKRTVKMRLKEVIRQMSHGSFEKAQHILASSKGGTMLNTSFIERLNGTMRERLASLTRRCRHASSKLHAFHTGMYLIGSTYNFCWIHHELSKSVEKGGLGRPCTPAMASGLTNHIWSVFELLSYKVPPPLFGISDLNNDSSMKNYCKPKKSQKSLVRLRKGVLCSTTS